MALPSVVALKIGAANVFLHERPSIAYENITDQIMKNNGISRSKVTTVQCSWESVVENPLQSSILLAMMTMISA